jgi:hypothetical protein
VASRWPLEAPGTEKWEGTLYADGVKRGNQNGNSALVLCREENGQQSESESCDGDN